MFDRQRLSTQEIVEDWKPLLLALGTKPRLENLIYRKSNPPLERRGAREPTQQSHPIASHGRLQKDYPGRIAYFPAYEILMDELRDYRFYADDMLHPSPLAIDYIWQRFYRKFLIHRHFGNP